MLPFDTSAPVPVPDAPWAMLLLFPLLALVLVGAGVAIAYVAWRHSRKLHEESATPRNDDAGRRP